jgi:hypothetical protein
MPETSLPIKILDMFSVHLQFAAAVLLLWLVIRMTDQSVVSTVRHIIAEISALGQITPKGINLLGGILMFALTIFLFFGGLAHIALPGANSHGGTSDSTRAIYLAVMFIFGLYFIICVKVTENRR